jgi:hypothetical protein
VLQRRGPGGRKSEKLASGGLGTVDGWVYLCAASPQRPLPHHPLTPHPSPLHRLPARIAYAAVCVVTAIGVLVGTAWYTKRAIARRLARVSSGGLPDAADGDCAHIAAEAVRRAAGEREQEHGPRAAVTVHATASTGGPPVDWIALIGPSAPSSCPLLPHLSRSKQPFFPPDPIYSPGPGSGVLQRPWRSPDVADSVVGRPPAVWPRPGLGAPGASACRAVTASPIEGELTAICPPCGFPDNWMKALQIAGGGPPPRRQLTPLAPYRPLQSPC